MFIEQYKNYLHQECKNPDAFEQLCQKLCNDIYNVDSNDQDDTKISKCAYILATIKWETDDTFLPIRERGKGKGMKYGKVVDGNIYYGRGYIQLTWDWNYRQFGKLLDIDLYNDPDLALDPKIAYDILLLGMTKGLFTGKKLNDYINNKIIDYYNARRIVNGVDRAVTIQDLADNFEDLLTSVLNPNEDNTNAN